MYKTLIVDDEPLMRAYLSDNLSAVCPAFTVTGTACNGKEAMEWLQRQRFDLVITDIRMPEMDGLSLSKYICEAFPQIRVIILSGYNEFEYARNALKYHVTEYLLKPLNDSDLLDALQNVREQLALLKENSAPPSAALSDGMNLQELGGLFLSSVLDGEPGQVYPLMDSLERRGFHLDGKKSRILLLYLDEISVLLSGRPFSDLSALKTRLWRLCRDYCFPRNILCTPGQKGSIYLLLTAAEQDELKSMADSVYEDLCCETGFHHAPKLLASCGRAVCDVLELSVSAGDAETAGALALLGRPAPFFQEQCAAEEAFLNRLADQCARVYQDYLSSDSRRLLVDTASYAGFFRGENTAGGLLSYGAYLLHYICSRSSIKIHYRKAAYDRLCACAGELLPTGSFPEDKLTGALYSSVLCLISPGRPAQPSGALHIAESAGKYILAHYSEPLSLSRVAEEIGVNSCYLSDIFHKHMGEPYSAYLLRVRMEQAARMLRENPGERIYRIAERTGFASSKHFITVFKKYYGMTPTAWADGEKP